MGKILSEGEFWTKLGIRYAIKVGYWAGRAIIGDAKETLAGKNLNDLSGITTRNVVTWRTETVAKRVVNGLMASLNLSDALSYFVHRKQLENLKKIREEQADTYQQLIKDGVTAKENTFGFIELQDDSNKKVWALDAEGGVVRDALILYYVGDTSKKKAIKIPKVSEDSNSIKVARDSDGNAEKEDATTACVFFCDLSPEITMESSKNIIMTPVQGRNYTRKELIACGDMTFTIRGAAVSHNLYAYPKEDVARLLNIYQYGGIVEVNNMIFDNYGVKQMLIKSLHFDKQDCNNVQPYTMQCVAVEPADALVEYNVNAVKKMDVADDGYDFLEVVNQLQKASGVNFNLSNLVGGIL